MEAILYGGFLLVAIIMMLPGGLNSIKSYVRTMLWLQLWSPLYSILHMIMMMGAQKGSLSSIASSGSSAINLHTYLGLANVNSEMATFAGFATLSIPVIAWGLVSGASFALTALASQFSSIGQQAATRGAEEATTGNLGFGNVQMDTMSAYNTSANHFNTSGSYQSGGYSYVLPGGSMASITPGGHQVMDNTPAISKLGVSGNLAETFRQTSHEQAERSFSMAQSDMRGFQNSTSTMLKNLYEFGNTASHALASGHSSSLSNSANFESAASQVSQMVDRFAVSHHISHSQASKLLEAAYIDGSVGVNTKDAALGKLASLTIGASAKADLGGKIEGSHAATKDYQQLFNAAKEFNQQTHFSDTVNQAVRAMQEDSVRGTDENSSRLISNIGSSFDQAQGYRHDMQTNFQAGESYRSMESFAKENALSINANENQKFADWMQDKQGIGGSQLENMMVNSPEKATNYWNEFSKQESANMMKAFKSQGLSSRSISQDYTQSTKSLPGEDQIASSHEAQYAAVEMGGNASGLSHLEINNALDSSVKGVIGTADNQILDKTQEILHNKTVRETQVNTEYNK